MDSLEKAPSEQEASGLKPTNIAMLVVIGMTVIMLVFFVYLLFFRGHEFSSDPAAWGQFGDFIGGTANPILSFITLVLLAFTLAVQNRQLNISSRELELSRKALEFTRQELQRSAQAQELSEISLKVQAESALSAAKISGYDSLLKQYSEHLIKIQTSEDSSIDKQVKNTFLDLQIEMVTSRLADELTSLESKFKVK